MLLTELQNTVASQLKTILPSYEVVSYFESMFEDSDSFRAYSAPAALVVISDIAPNPNETPFDATITLGIVLVPESSTALDSHYLGWEASEKIAKFLRGKTFDCKNIRNAKEIRIQKQERRDKEDSPTGLFYWQITWQHEMNYDNTL